MKIQGTEVQIKPIIKTVMVFVMFGALFFYFIAPTINPVFTSAAKAVAQLFK